MMEYSDEARKYLTEACEGDPPDVYLDPLGIPTGGYGHTKGLTKDDVGNFVFPSQADVWLKQDIQESVDAVNKYCTVKLSQHQFDALVDFAFNCGAGNLEHSTLLKKVNDQDFAGADEEFGRWVNGGGHRLPGLVKRRALEAAWFNTGD